ncbi:LOW QUALITY PROTEIN: hypothetical protein U9M48_000618 [Paspalum notatum var. saurae]|uniref:Uncharacterized protein n=1 Tax=Paspalum notatum var. saurae TaxID=547442 RepID=A0AAQ3PF06_PASNO
MPIPRRTLFVNKLLCGYRSNMVSSAATSHRVNNLAGSIPAVLSNLTRLTALALPLNGLTGPIPTFLGNFSELYFLSLGGNQLSRSVPPALGNIPALTILSLLTNNLDGDLSFLFSLSKCRKIQLLELANNSFTGGRSHRKPVNGINFYRYRKLTGRLPSTLSNLSNLESIGLSNNLLTGEIPESIS